MTKKQRTQKRKRRDRKRRRLAQPPVAGAGELKMSQVIIDLAEPLMDATERDPEKVEVAILLAIKVWNLALGSAAEREKAILSMLETVYRDRGAEEATSLAETIDLVEERRKRLYPGIRRRIVSHDLQVDGERVRLNVLSTLSLTTTPTAGSCTRLAR